MATSTSHLPYPVMMASRDKKQARRQRRKQARNTQPLDVKDDVAELLLFGGVGWDIDAKEVTQQLRKTKASTINVIINSGGGSVFDGMTIYNELVAHDAEIIVNIEGAALSIASVIAMAGDTIRMAANAFMMIHDPVVYVDGDAKKLKNAAELLEKIKISAVATYAARTGLDASVIEEMMSDETWMDADEALEKGFITEIVDVKKVAASCDLDVFSNVPAWAHDLAAGEPADAQEDFTMNKKLRALCVKAGMPDDLDDDKAQEWMVENADKISEAKAKEKEGDKKTAVLNEKLRVKLVAAGMPEDHDDTQAQDWLAENADKLTKADPPAGDDDPKLTASDIGDAIDKAMATREKKKQETVKLHKEFVDDCLLGFDDVPGEIRDACYQAEGKDAVRNAIKDWRSKIQKDTPINFSRSQPREEQFKDVGTALKIRCMHASGASEATIEKHVPKDDRGKNWTDFQDVAPLELARQCMLMDGWSYNVLARMSTTDLAQAAWGFGHMIPSVRDMAPRLEAVHTTGSLPKITLDAINKSLLAGYEEAPQTWRGPGRQAASVTDFKTIHRIRLGAVPNLPDWPDNTNPEVAKLKDEEETYAVEAKSLELNFSWRLWVNDDMDALSRRPRLLGDAAARTVNSNFWNQVTSNPTLGADSVALFSTATGNRKRSNDVTSGAAPNNAQIDEMRKLMRLMRGVNTPEDNESDDVLNLTPKFLIGPAALEGAMLRLVRATGDPEDNKSSATYNTAGNLTPIVEPLLDANSALIYYLFADPGRVDTVEVTFLQGQETPQIRDFVDDRSMSRNIIVLQTFAAKAIDHRGVIRNAGA